MKIYFIGSVIVAVAIFIVFFYNIFRYRSLLLEKKINSILLLLLRCFSILVLLILFLDPHIFYYNSVDEQKEANIFIDNSKSIEYQGISIDSIGKLILNIDQLFLNNNINTNFFIFGDSLERYNQDNLDLNDPTTNFIDIEDYINSNLNEYNLLVTDGNSSHGYNLLDLDFNSPINIIGMGETSNQDIALSSVTHNDFVTRGDSIDLNIEITSILDTITNTTITISSNNDVLLIRPLKLNKGKNISRIHEKISTDNTNGELDFRIVTLDKINENILNNSYKTKVYLIDKSREVLLVSGALNSNTKEIKKISSLIPNCKVEHVYKVNNNWNVNLESLSYKDYELIIYDNFPLTDYDLKIYSSINKNIDTRIIYFEGPGYNVKTINEIFKKKNMNFDAPEKEYTYNFSDISGSLSTLPSVKRNYIFEQESFSKIYLLYEDKTVAIAEYLDQMYVLIPETSKLLLKDKMNNFREFLFDIMYVFIDRGSDIKFNIKKREVLTDEHIPFSLDLPDIYDINKTEIVINNLKKPEQSLNIKLSKINVNKTGDRYLQDLEEGEYEVYSKVLLDDTYYSSRATKVTVKSENYESNNLYRNTTAMSSLALKTKGNYYTAENYNDIMVFSNTNLGTLNKKNDINVHTFHNYWFIILLTLIIEWFLRKRKGLL